MNQIPAHGRSTPAAPRSESLVIRIIACLGVGLLTLGYLKFHAATHSPERLSSAAEFLLQGKTHWITFQNRLLGSFLVDLIRLGTGLSWLQSFQALMAACMGVGAALLLWHSWRTTGKSFRGIIGIAAWFALGFLCNHTWSYPWDYTGALLILLVMLWGQVHFRSPADLKSWLLLALLLLLVLNRESSLIVLAGLIVALAGWGWQHRQWIPAVRAIVVLGLGAVANVIAVISIRVALFTESTRPPGHDGPETAAGNFTQLTSNLRKMLHADTHYEYIGTGIIFALFVGSVWLLVSTLNSLRRSRLVSPGTLLARACFCIASVAIILFADFAELRVYFELIPIALVLAFDLPPTEPVARVK
jgi:hypothetical protein